MTDPVVGAFVAIPLLLVAALVWGTALAWRRSGATPSRTRRVALVTGIAAIAWLAAAWVVGDSGILREWDRTPPPIVLFVLAITSTAIAIAFSPYGRRLTVFLPLWALVGIQAFRLPLELAMHQMFERGVMPQQMSYSGRNFDIVTGVTAIVVALLVASGRGGHRLVFAWNVLGSWLLLNIVVVAILSTPRFRYFGDHNLNVWVTYPPFVWLPAVMVLAAMAGHLMIFRALLTEQPGD
jgi:hypothetical protein